MLEARAVQPAADRRHHAVHHARRRDDVGAGLRVDDRRPRQQFQRRIVEQVARGQRGLVVRLPGQIDDATVPVVGVLAEAHVRDHQQLGRGVLDRTDRLRHDAVRAVVVAAGRVLGRRDAEQDHGRNAQRGDRLRLTGQLIDAEL